jgi:hypothetical protein
MKNVRRNAVIGGIVFACIIASAGSSAQPGPPRPTLVQQPITLRPVTIAPSLKTTLTNKRAFDATKLQNVVRTDADGAVIRRHGRDYRLLAEDKATRAVRSQVLTLPPHLVKHQENIQRWQPGLIDSYFKDRVVDHRDKQSPIKDQGSRGTCSAFATVAALEAYTKRATGTFGDYSENDTFVAALAMMGQSCTQTGGVHTWAAVDVAQVGLCNEAEFAYTPTCPTTGIPAVCAKASNAKLPATFAMTSYAHPVPGVPVDTAHRADNVSLLESWLDGGHDIVFALDCAGTDWGDSTLDTGVIDVQVDAWGHPAGAFAAHAILMVGYDHNNRYFIFKNSWGADNGHAGYIYLSYDYVQTYAWYGFAVLH